jgi:hypothetical protein
MTAVAKALRDARGPRAGRFSQVVVLRSGPTFVTAGPVLSGKETVGVVLAMTPLADVLGRLSQELRATLTAYDLGGAPIATTAADVPARIDRTTARALASGGPIVTRAGREREALGRLIVDHQPSALLGVALEDRSWETGRAVIGYVVLGLLCTVVIAGSYGIRLGRRLRG